MNDPHANESLIAPVSGMDCVRFSIGLTMGGTYFDILELEGGAWRPPIVMLHGAIHSGACYLATAELKPGWAHYFAALGHKVFVVDLPGCGRSGALPFSALTGTWICSEIKQIIEQASDPVILFTHSMSGAYGWKLMEIAGDRIAAIVAVAASPPGNIQPIATIAAQGADFVEVQRASDSLKVTTTEPFSFSRAFVDEKLIGQGSYFPRQHADRYQSSLQTIPPLLVVERLNIDGRQLSVTDFIHFPKIRVLVLSGSHDFDYIVHDRPIVDWLLSHGAAAELLSLEAAGIVGNGHMIMLETNSEMVAEKIGAWLG